MKRIIILKRILPCIAALLVFANCKNLFQPPELPQTEAPAQSGEGTFSLEIGGVRAGRTILPATVQDDFAAYALVFTADGKRDVSAERTNANLGEAVILPAGTWNLTVTAFMDSEKTKPAAQGSISGIEISGGGSVSRSLELTPVIEAGATGTFRWNISYPSDVTSAGMTITPLDTATGTAAQTLYFVGGEPLTDKNNAAAPLALQTGYYRVTFNLSKGKIETGREEYLHIYKNMESRFEYTFTPDYFTVYSVISGDDSGPGSLRYAIENAVANSTIMVEVETINMESYLEIRKNLTIRGNGLTLTAGAGINTRLLYVSGSDITVNISRVHFKNGRAGGSSGAAIYNNDGTINLESCIFSGNQTTSNSGGAIYNYVTMNIKGCTFYNNSSAYQGGAIYNDGTLTLTGNLFYGNTAASGGPVVYNSYSSGPVTSSGYNAVDVALGTGTAQSGWNPTSGDKTITAGTWPVSPVSFRLLGGSGAASVISTLPAGYPATDFYGVAISNGAAVGAVQNAASGSGYVLDLSINNSSQGSVSASPAPDADGIVPAGTVTLTASPAEGCILVNWLVNRTAAGSTNPLTLSITGHTSVQAVFGRLVTVTAFTDASGSATTEGTLRHALTNVQDGDIIRFTGVTAGTTAIELGSALPQVSKNVTIEGNGVTLTRGAAWATVYSNSQLLSVSGSAITVNISRVHFKDGRATGSGAAVFNNNYYGTVNLESCIFSGNQTSSSNDYSGGGGGAIYTSGTMNVKGCTFYNNSTAYQGGGIYNRGGTLTLTGNLFYGNTAAANSGPVVYHYQESGNSGTVTSNGYNAVDVALGTESTQSGWTSTTGDKTITAGTLQVSPVSFRLLGGSGAASVITTLPAAYPATDFYGTAISNGAAAGAVQSTASGSGYALVLSVNNNSWGSISATPAPDTECLVPAGTVTLTASPEQGYDLAYWLVNGVYRGSTNPLSLNITAHTTIQAVFGRPVTVTAFTDASDSATTEGTLRHALTNAQDWDIIRFTGVTAGTTAIELGSALPYVSKNVSIEGNGVTLTRSASWTTVDYNSHLLSVSGYGITVNIRRIHFKDGRATGSGAAVFNNNYYGTVNLESCIFSGNQTSSSNDYSGGGAIDTDGTMSIKGCTFYNNSSAYRGGAIYNSVGTLTLTGNLFYGNTAASGGQVVYRGGGTVTSSGYNAVDVALGTESTQSGWTSATGDKTITAGTLQVSPVSFRLLGDSDAASVITTLPAAYPATDFYGTAISNGAAAGAVQSTASGYLLELSVNNSSRGSISAAPAPDADGIVPAGTVTLTANPAQGYNFAYWLVNGVHKGSTNPLSLTITAHTTIQAVFGRLVTVTAFTDASGSATTEGTLRYALTNAQDWDIIRFTGVTAGTTAIELGSALPCVSKNVTIEGNGITLTRSASWTTVDNSSQLLYVYDSSSAITVNISRVHFKNGRATGPGAAIRNAGETINLESCIFSGNRTSDSGGAIYTDGTMNVKGCTFYNNSTIAYYGGAICSSGTLTLTGNLFYGNTSASGGPVVYRGGGTVTSSGYNAVDVALGTESTQSGWASATGDKTITAGTLQVSPVLFRLLGGSGAANVISTLPAGYPVADFYGAAISSGAAAGAVQSTASGSGYPLELSVNNSSRGSISAAPAPDADGIVPAGIVTLTASPAQGYDFAYWLVNGVYRGSTNPLSLNITVHTTIQAVFGKLVTVTAFTDASDSATTEGTLRYALTNVEDNGIIRFTGVTAGTTAIELGSALSTVNKNVTIEGSGVTLTRSAAWATVDNTSQLLSIYNSSAAITVNISRVHFKNGRATNYGAAIRNAGETINLESCIFSGNQTSSSNDYSGGGAICTYGSMNVEGCTFYNNSTAIYGGAIYNSSGTLTLTGNLFYGNTAASGGQVVYRTSGTVTSGGYNVVDVALGTESTQSGWTAAPGDNTFTALGITGAPLTPATFAPVTELNTVIPSAPANFPAADFNGSARTWPGAPGAVK